MLFHFCKVRKILNIENVKLRIYKINQLFYCSKTAKEEIIVKSILSDINIPDAALPEVLFQNVHKWKRDTAVACSVTGTSYNFKDLFLAACNLAINLRKICGVNRNETVAIYMPNLPEFPICFFGIIMSGMITTFLSPSYTKDEIIRQVIDSKTKLIITTKELAPKINFKEILKEYKGMIVIGSNDDFANNVYSFQTVIKKQCDECLPKLNTDDPVILPYSSGTSGLPKGVPLTHRNLIANLLQIQDDMFMDRCTKSRISQETCLSPLPFNHIFALTCVLHISIYNGFRFVTMPKFTPEYYQQALRRYQPDILFVVPTLLSFISNSPVISKRDLHNVRMIVSGASPLKREDINIFLNKIGRDDVSFMQGYGMTETSPVTLLTPNNAPKSKLHSCGILLPNTEAKIMSLITNECLGPNRPGELYVRGPQAIKCYWYNPEATRELIDDESWVHTGDIAKYDEDGYFYIVGRTKELIKVKGHQVSPTELENIILEIPTIADAAVVGVPDERAGEVPIAFVVLKPNAEEIPKDEIFNHVKPRVIRYKHLSGIEFIEKIPRTNTGKILRNYLKDLYLKKFTTSSEKES